MKKAILFAVISILFIGIFYASACYRDKRQLQDEIIRLHVVANSDSDADQAQKLRVRDAVNDYLGHLLESADSAQEAMQIIGKHLHELETVAQDLLFSEGTEMSVRASLQKEMFDIREYETFTLPSGIYTALRIELGEAKGKNWWCVVFPSLCLPAAGDSFADTAAGAGFSDSLSNSLTGKYQFRFFVIDLYGQLEKLFANP